MSCGVGCGGDGPRRWSPEFSKPWKAENNSGCACGGSNRNKCTTPSLAKPGTPRWKWEQIHGKLVTVITFGQDPQGHPTTHVEKVVCPKEERKRNKPCCSFSYSARR